MRIDLDHPSRGNWNLSVEYGGRVYLTRPIDAQRAGALIDALKVRPFPAHRVRSLLADLFEGSRRPDLATMSVDQLAELAAYAHVEFHRAQLGRVMQLIRRATDEVRP